MRNLCLERRKSFVGCAMKDQVYIRDDLNPELTIAGVPCRRLGTLKNGATETFLIPEGEQEIFLIVDKVSKDYCYARATVAAEGDVSLSGKHYYVFGSNPFRFDGAEITPAQKKNGRKGIAITTCAIIIGVIVGLCLPNLQVLHQKTFTREEFQITLTDDFEEGVLDGFYAAYTSKTAMVFVLREEKSYFDGATLEQYAELIQEANERTGLSVNQGDGYLWFAFTETVEDQELFYIAVCCESEDAFWVVNFATPSANQEQYQPKFLGWADTIAFVPAA